MKAPFLPIALFIVILITGCERGYKVEEGQVLYIIWDTGSGKRELIIADADPITFQILRHSAYAKDASRGYYKGKPISPIDPDTFESINSFHARDKDQAYYADKAIPSSHGPTFRVIKGNWAKDAQAVYYQTKRVESAKPVTFEVIGGFLDSWARDGHSYFFREMAVPADYATFQILDGGWARDAGRIYYETRAVPEADPETFALVKSTYIARDKNGFYRFGEPFTPSQAWLRDMGL